MSIQTQPWGYRRIVLGVLCGLFSLTIQAENSASTKQADLKPIPSISMEEAPPPWEIRPDTQRSKADQHTADTAVPKANHEQAEDAEPSQSSESPFDRWYQSRQEKALPDQTTLQIIKNNAENGDRDAQYELALLHQRGAFGQVDMKQALVWLERAAKAGQSKAQFALGTIYREGIGTKPDKQQAAHWYTQAAKQGHADAQYALALLSTGQAARTWYEKAAKQGHLASRLSLLIRSRLAEPDMSKVDMAQKNVASSASPAQKPQTQIAQAQPSNRPPPIITPIEKGSAMTAAKIAQEFADHSPRVQVQNNDYLDPEEDLHKMNLQDVQLVSLGQQSTNVIHTKPPTLTQPTPNSVNSHPTDSGDKPSVQTATTAKPSFNLATLDKRAESGDKHAQLFLGVIYEDGRKGVKRNERQAAYWYRKAADQGFAKAQYNLAILHEDGRGVQKNEQQAVYWYKRAAEGGFAEAQNNLALMLLTGRGVPKDETLAKHWFQQAAEQGNSEAQRNLDVLRK